MVALNDGRKWRWSQLLPCALVLFLVACSCRACGIEINTDRGSTPATVVPVATNTLPPTEPAVVVSSATPTRSALEPAATVSGTSADKTAVTDESTDKTTLTAKAAQVQHQSPGNSGEIVPEGEQRNVIVGEKINVNDIGRALLVFPDCLRVDIYRESDLSLEAVPDPGTPLACRFRQSAGTTFNTVTPRPISQRVSISTPALTITATGTKIFVYVDRASGATWVVIIEGSATVSGAGVAISVPAGFQTWADVGFAPVGPVPATRTAVGNKFPSITQITRGELSDKAILPQPQLSADAQPSVVRYGSCDPGTLTIRATLSDASQVATVRLEYAYWYQGKPVSAPIQLQMSPDINGSYVVSLAVSQDIFAKTQGRVDQLQYMAVALDSANQLITSSAAQAVSLQPCPRAPAAPTITDIASTPTDAVYYDLPNVTCHNGEPQQFTVTATVKDALGLVQVELQYIYTSIGGKTAMNGAAVMKPDPAVRDRYTVTVSIDSVGANQILHGTDGVLILQVYARNTVEKSVVQGTPLVLKACGPY